MTRPALSPTPRSTIKRGKNRAVQDRDELDNVLRAGLICHFAVVVNGSPVVLPTCYGFDSDTLFLHGSTGASSLREAAQELEVSVAITLFDGLVYARSVFNHSVNYRSAVVHGRAVPVTDDAEKLRALKAIVDHVTPGSWEHSRQPTRKELAATEVLAIDLTEAAVKIRTGPPGDDDEDVAAGISWAGVLPARQVWGEPEPCPLLPAEFAVPPHVADRPD